MIKNRQAELTKDLANKKLIITRDFDAPVAKVWEAWTDRNLLDSWWAPKPYKARTKSMDFRPGGLWLYAMVGPDNSESWCRVDFESIIDQKQFTATDAFCDADGNRVPEPPGMHWKNDFIQTASGTTVHVEITFASEEDLQKILDMGFEEGFNSGLSNLDTLLAG